jgi:hypothetical protein
VILMYWHCFLFFFLSEKIFFFPSKFIAFFYDFNFILQLNFFPSKFLKKKVNYLAKNLLFWAKKNNHQIKFCCKNVNGAYFWNFLSKKNFFYSFKIYWLFFKFNFSFLHLNFFSLKYIKIIKVLYVAKISFVQQKLLFFSKISMKINLMALRFFFFYWSKIFFFFLENVLLFFCNFYFSLQLNFSLKNFLKKKKHSRAK